MKIKKIVVSILSAVFITSTLVGCGSNTTSTESSTGNNSNGEVVTLTYTTWGSPEELKAQTNAVKEFEKNNPNIKVKLQHIPTDYDTKLATMIAGNTAPDVSLMYKTTALAWADQGKIRNISPLLEKDSEISEDTYIDGSFIHTDKDTIIGITPCQEVFGLYYNIDAFKEAGIELPPTKAEDAWTWDEFIEVCKKLTIDQNGKNATEDGFDPNNIKQYGMNMPTSIWQTFLNLNDVKYVSDDGMKSNLTDPTVIDTIQKLADLSVKYHVAPSPAQSKTLPAPAVALQSKKIAMDWDGQWVQIDLANAKVNYDVGVLPKMKNNKTTLFGEVMCMFDTTKHPEEAWKFLKWMTSGEGTKDLITSGLWMPTVKSWYTDPEIIESWVVKPGHPDGYKEAILDQAMNNSVPDSGYYIKNSVKISSIISPALDQVWSGDKTAEEALKEIEPKVVPELKGVYTNK